MNRKESSSLGCQAGILLTGICGCLLFAFFEQTISLTTQANLYSASNLLGAALLLMLACHYAAFMEKHHEIIIMLCSLLAATANIMFAIDRIALVNFQTYVSGSFLYSFLLCGVIVIASVIIHYNKAEDNE